MYIKKSILIGVLCLLVLPFAALAQTAGGTTISNVASYTYRDPANNNHTGTSNQVDVVVAKVGGLTITPDAQTTANLVPNQTVVLPFAVTNTSNFAQSVVFPASGAGISVSGPVTVTRAVIDANSNGSIDAADTDIRGNAAAVTSANIAANSMLPVLVEIQATAAATPGAAVVVNLGDTATNAPSYDDQPANSSANEVHTADATAVNGVREAKGNYTTAIEKDAMLVVTLGGPAGPVAPSDVMTYTAATCNTGNRAATSITLSGGGSQVYIIVPIPVGTYLQSGQTFPVGTLYSIDPTSTAPTLANWTSTPPGSLLTVTRLAFPVGASLAASVCSSNYPFNVVVKTNVTPATPIVEIADVFGTNAIGNVITDQSGDVTPNQGNGNGSTVPVGGTAGVTGIPLVTPIAIAPSVLNGPLATPTATGPTNNNDDYTNKAGIAGITVVPGATTTSPNVVTFDNTLQNTGNADDTFKLSTPTVPSGATVEISLDGGTTWVTTSGGGSTAATSTVLPNGTVNYKVRVSLPAGQPVLTALDTIVRATSQNDTTKINDTIDRVYCGYLQLIKTASINNTTGVGGANDAVPGAIITYTITYSNVSSTGGTGCITLTATNIVITENGTAAPNNWGSTTDHVVGSALDSNSGAVTGDNAITSTLLTDTVPSLGPQASGTFTYKRKFK